MSRAQPSLPTQLPELPEGHRHQQATFRAYEIVKNGYERSVSILYQDDNDPIRLRIHCQDILARTIPLFLVLVDDVSNIEEDWVSVSLEYLYNLASTLHVSSEAMSRRSVFLPAYRLAQH